MPENKRRITIIKGIGIIGLLLPLISFAVIFQITYSPQIVQEVLKIYTFGCFVIPPLIGIYLLVSFFSNKSKLLLLLALLNLVSPVWLFYILIITIFKDGGGLRWTM